METPILLIVLFALPLLALSAQTQEPGKIMDVLDPSEVRGHSLPVPQGPTSQELAAAIQKMFAYPKVAAIGIVSLPFGERDKQGISLKAAYCLIEGAIKGVKGR